MFAYFPEPYIAHPFSVFQIWRSLFSTLFPTRFSTVLYRLLNTFFYINYVLTPHKTVIAHGKFAMCDNCFMRGIYQKMRPESVNLSTGHTVSLSIIFW